MKVERKYLHGLLKDALSEGVLGYVDPVLYGPAHDGGGPYCHNRFGWYDYKDYIKLDDSPENMLSRKFLEVVRQFIKDNDIIFIASTDNESYVPIEYDVYIVIDDVKYVITDEQQNNYYDLLQNANAIRAAKYLSEIFALPLCVTYEFTKKNRYLTIVY